jgi:histidinol dehydrogenase
MKKYLYPDKAIWPSITGRPNPGSEEIAATIAKIMDEVRRHGDRALRELTLKFDGFDVSALRVTGEELDAAEREVTDELREAISVAAGNIERFHAAQRSLPIEIETFPGVVCGRKQVPIEKAGIYVPGGTAPLFSTVLMLAIPAKLAGCGTVVLCTPPGKDGKVDPAILYAARQCGVTDIFRVGGAQAIAAMAFGTGTIPKVDKIFGPGNRYVTEAKMFAAARGIAIDMPAGPSEVLVIADKSCDPSFVAADLLSQAEHGADSQVVLLTDSEAVLDEVEQEVARQLSKLPRKEIAEAALENSRLVLLRDMREAVELANEYASEHLVIASDEAEAIAEEVVNAGSVFLGHYACESAGDYASGTNHTLPTGGFARAYSGVSLDSFCKHITFQRISPEGIAGLGPSIEVLAEAEGLFAHRNAVTLRIKDVKRKQQAAGAGNDEG